MILFVVVFFLSDLLRNIFKCNCSQYSTWMTMYLPEVSSKMRELAERSLTGSYLYSLCVKPEASSIMRALASARCTDVRLYT